MNKKIIKLKESDLKNFVKRLLESNEFDTSDITEVDPTSSEFASDAPSVGDAKIQLGKDPVTGKIYVVNNKTGDVMGVK